MFRSFLESIFARSGGLDLISECLEIDCQGADDLFLVVYDQDSGMLIHLLRSLRESRTGTSIRGTGLKPITMVAPPPGVSSMSSSWSIASSKPRATARPSPTPL